jgi:hypothetical protein
VPIKQTKNRSYRILYLHSSNYQIY